ncbi:FAD-binding oxidoreductase [Shewanella maritima]|uniref:FAD-binding oxidoreductase n=1 Tax=Shewanella maritima TaxID=2520507 RepID=UPI0037370E14
MSASGFSFSSALSQQQSKQKQDNSSAKPAQSAASDSGGFSFSSALSKQQSDNDANVKSATKSAGGFSFANALSQQQAEPAVSQVAVSKATSSEQAKNLLAADEWLRGEMTLKCVAKWQETHDVVSFKFQGLEPVKFNFKPGQFLTFKLMIDGKPVFRSYTIASSPSRPYSLTVTIKRIEGGVVSNYLADTLNVDDKVTVTGPDGAFNLVDINADKYLFLSAGSGVTPMHSMSRWLCDTTTDSNIAFVHSARSAKDIIFADAMASMAQRSDSFSLSYVLEDDSQHQDLLIRYPQTQCDAGRLTIEKLQALVPDYKSRTVFICGPTPYMDAVKALLVDAGFDMANFYQESFGDTPKVSQAMTKLSPSEHAAAGGFMLKIGDKAIPLGSEQTLLEGIESESLSIIAACRNGVCGACKCQVTEGEVSSDSTATLTAAEIEAGFVLACSTKIRSDVSLKM